MSGACRRSSSTAMGAFQQRAPDLPMSQQEAPLRRRGSILYRAEPSDGDDLADLAANYALLERRSSADQEGATNVAE